MEHFFDQKRESTRKGITAVVKAFSVIWVMLLFASVTSQKEEAELMTTSKT